MQVLIIGNSGSGKSTLAGKLSVRSGLPVTALDEIFWLPGGFGAAREPDEQDRLLEEATASQHWIVEGVFGRLIGVVLQRSSHLVWLDMPWEGCRQGILARPIETGRQSPELLAWASQYWEREGRTSFSGHRSVFESFPEGRRLRFTARDEIDAWLAAGASLAG